MAELRAPEGIRLLALDIDGTMAPEEGIPAPHIAKAVRQVHQAGVEIILVTGRPVHAVADVIQALRLDEIWVGASNGAVLAVSTQGKWSIVATETFDPRPAMEAVLEADPDAGLVVEEPGQGYRLSRPLPSAVGQEPHIQWIGVLERTTFAAVATQAIPLEALAELASGKGATVMPWHWEGWDVVDLQAAHVSKATAVQAIAERRGWSASECTAVGDYLNDMEMLRWAGWSVAMGHAPAEVRAIADAVAPPFDEDGLLAVTNALLAAKAQESRRIP